jgi:hypothetical protein
MIPFSTLVIIGYITFTSLGRCTDTLQTCQTVEHNALNTKPRGIAISRSPSDKISSLILQSTLTDHVSEFSIDQTDELYTSETHGISSQYGPMRPQFANPSSLFSYEDTYRGEVIWKGGPHVIGQIANVTGELQPTRPIRFIHQNNFLPPKPLHPVTLHPPRPLAEPPKVRRFMKIVKRDCLT